MCLNQKKKLATSSSCVRDFGKVADIKSNTVAILIYIRGGCTWFWLSASTSPHTKHQYLRIWSIWWFVTVWFHDQTMEEEGREGKSWEERVEQGSEGGVTILNFVRVSFSFLLLHGLSVRLLGCIAAFSSLNIYSTRILTHRQILRKGLWLEFVFLSKN